MTGEPTFWVLIVAFAAIWAGIAGHITRQLSPYGAGERGPFWLVLVGIVIVVGVTIDKVLG